MHPTHDIVLKPQNRRSLSDRLSELWDYRELLLIFMQREVSVRYKQTVIGIAWTVLQPLLSAAIFAVIFGLFAKFPSGQVPYLLFAFCGVIAWQYMARVLTDGANGFVNNANMLSKIYFPRLLFGLVPVCYGLIDFALSFSALLVLCAIMGVMPHATIVLAPFIIIAGGLLAYGMGLILAPINAIYRDVAIALPFLIQILMYVSPIVFSQSIVPERYHWVVDFNPIATIVILLRWAVFGGDLPSLTGLIVCAISLIAFVWAGMQTVAKLEETLVDKI